MASRFARQMSCTSGMAVCMRKASSNDVDAAFQGRVRAGRLQVLAVHLGQQIELQPLQAPARRVALRDERFTMAWSAGMLALPIGVPW